MPSSQRRQAGVLLHPTSLPGPFGAGDLGPRARGFVEWCEAAGFGLWQVLPLNPVDEHGCPYASPSAFAREPLLLSVDDLVRDGWLTTTERPFVPGHPGRVDYARLRKLKEPALLKAADRIRADVDLDHWVSTRPWAQDWASFRALQRVHGLDWTAWPANLRDRSPAELDQALAAHADWIGQELALQWAFEGQWRELKAFANERSIELWGDIPYFVGGESADVWANRELFRLNPDGTPQTLSGVPPDDFSPTGQLWGHPQYAEGRHERSGYAWWRQRVRATMELVDVLRIDHFRGLEAVWEIPATAEDAREGRWVPGPADALLEAFRDELGGLPFVAEDLGIITPPVQKLRDDFDLPGMAILQFAFGGDAHHAYLPHNHRKHLVVYTGTHDNDTTAGWFHSAPDAVKDRARRTLGVADRDIPWALLRAAWGSVANTAITPMQDLLFLGSEARMNVPGVEQGNWAWRMPEAALTLSLATRIREQLDVYGRTPAS